MSSYGGKGPLLVGVLAGEAALATITVALRNHATLVIVQRKGWDLLWNWIAYISALVATSLIIVAARHGLGNHMDNIRPEDLEYANMYNWAGGFCWIVSLTTGKVAVVALILRLQGYTRTWGRVFLYFVATSILVTLLVELPMFWVQCTPVKKEWEPLLPGSCHFERTAYIISMVFTAYYAACDLILSIYPIVCFWELKIKLQKKLLLSLLFCGGLLAGAAGFIKVSYLHELEIMKTPPVYLAFEPNIWGATESFLVVILSSLPTIAPFFTRKTPQQVQNITPFAKPKEVPKVPAYGVKEAEDWRNVSIDETALINRPGKMPRDVGCLTGLSTDDESVQVA